MTTPVTTTSSEPSGAITPLIAGVDSLYLSCDLPLSERMCDRLATEKLEAQASGKVTYCPEWLGARMCPQGAKGGYAYLIETEDFSVKLLGEPIPHRPGVFIEMRSHALHTHPAGAAGACAAALRWVRATLYADQYAAAKVAISFAAAKVSRADLHIDWQGGYAPTLTNISEELRCFIRPGRVKGALYFQGHTATGYQFGRSQVVARLYNKTNETAEKGNEAYAALLTARCGERYDPAKEVWRLEFEVKREGMKGFRLYAPPEEDDPDEEVEAELSAEELQHIGTFPRLFARLDELLQHLTRHWLRLVERAEDANRSRWPMHPTWQALRAAFGTLAGVPPLEDKSRQLVRGARYRGRARLLRRMEAGVIRTLEVEDASPTSAALLTLRRWLERIAEKEVERLSAKCARYANQGQPIPRWVRAGMDERFRRVERVEQRIQMLLGIFGAHGVLPLEFKPAHSVGDLLLQHLDALEQEAEEKGGVQQVLADHFAKVYKVAMPLTWPHDRRLAAPSECALCTAPPCPKASPNTRPRTDLSKDATAVWRQLHFSACSGVAISRSTAGRRGAGRASGRCRDLVTRWPITESVVHRAASNS